MAGGLVMKNQILFLFCLITTCCINNNTAGTESKQSNTSVDTVQLINTIRKEYSEINSKVAKYHKVEKNVFDQSAEGGVIIAYYDNKDLKKANTTFYGEMGKVMTEYYFNKDGLIFAYSIEYNYDKPMYIKGSKIVSMQENRYYLFRNQLIKWLDNNKKSVNPNSKVYQEANKNLLEDLIEIKK